MLESGLHHDAASELRQLGDMERILGRVAIGSARPRDLSALGQALSTLPEIQNVLSPLTDPLLVELSAALGPYPEVADLLERAIVPAPPVLIRDGGVIAAGYDAALDELRSLSTDADAFLVDLERRERERTGVSTLKVGYNRVHGYYIEMGRSHADAAPIEYVRRQTLKSAERYITEELKGFEDRVLGARERALAREKHLYEALLGTLVSSLAGLQDCARATAQIDVLVNFAERAESFGYCRPEFSSEPGIWVRAGRHPVVERIASEPFVPNDLELHDQRRMLVITGPNMGGKSTYMRQTAQIVLLAHVGSFVPADHAVVGPVDRIFTRIGAADDLAGGRSTFMLEMTEAANILHNATEHSLVLLDEIGRGTSTFDGLSLAWACAARLAESIRAFTLFATHYFELVDLPDHCPAVHNVHLDAVEHGRQIVFMHQVRDGPASRSYGLQVAALAGVPATVIDAASAILERLESGAREQSETTHPQLPLFAPSTADDASAGGADSAGPGPAAAPEPTTVERLLDELDPGRAHSPPSLGGVVPAQGESGPVSAGRPGCRHRRPARSLTPLASVER